MKRIESEADVAGLDFDKGGGRVTVIVQHARSAEVLMTAAADREAVLRTLQTGQVHFTSRTRGLWHKGATSGNFLTLETLTTDCDRDALLARVRPEGPTCHTGSTSCFGEPAAVGADELQGISRLAATLEARRESPAGYTGKLLGDRNLRLKKVGEEATELVVACVDQDRERIAEEAADLIYHLLVAARAEGVTIDQIDDVLRRRADRR